jgi:hypothetical protein
MDINKDCNAAERKVALRKKTKKQIGSTGTSIA